MHASNAGTESVDLPKSGGPRGALLCAVAGAILVAQAQAQRMAGVLPPSAELPAARLVIEGGRPLGRAWMLAQGSDHAGGEWLSLDERGRYSRELAPDELDGVNGLRFFVPSPAGAGAGPVWTETWRRHRRPQDTKLPTSASLVVTEIMKDPTFVSDSAGEYFEVLNAGSKPIDIEGWSISDLGSNFHVLSNGGAGVWISPGEHFVFGIQADPLLNGGIGVDYEYTSFSLSNGADEVVLSDSQGAVVDQVIFDGGQQWPDQPGSAMGLDPSAVGTVSNDDPANWCNAQSALSPGSSDSGTPGDVNDVCP